MVSLLGITKIPMLLLAAPRVLEITDEGCAIRIPFNRLTQNHVGSMYLGVLCAGADLVSGLNAFKLMRSRYQGVIPVFSELKAEFLKRADGDVVFRTGDGRAILEAVASAYSTGERVTIPVTSVATVPSKYGDEPVARFTVGLSVKKKKS